MMIDPVDRGAVIAELRACTIEAATLYGTNDALKTAFKESLRGINALPNVEAERKRGKWVKMSDAFGTYYACDYCGEDCTPHGMKTPFCPNCGADMRGGEDAIH